MSNLFNRLDGFITPIHILSCGSHFKYECFQVSELNDCLENIFK